MEETTTERKWNVGDVVWMVDSGKIRRGVVTTLSDMVYGRPAFKWEGFMYAITEWEMHGGEIYSAFADAKAELLRRAEAALQAAEAELQRVASMKQPTDTQHT